MKETLSKLKKIDNFILIKEGGSHWQAATVGWKLDLLKKKWYAVNRAGGRSLRDAANWLLIGMKVNCWWPLRPQPQFFFQKTKNKYTRRDSAFSACDSFIFNWFFFLYRSGMKNYKNYFSAKNVLLNLKDFDLKFTLKLILSILHILLL